MPVTSDTFVGTATPLSQHGFDDVVSQLGVDAPSLWALLTVETRGFGFLADRRPKILFERHIFHNRTGGQHSASHPEISSKTSGGYAPSGAGEYARLARAIALNRVAALESASWGLGQVMGFHAVRLRYLGVNEMVAAFAQSEDAQLDGSRRFIADNAALASAFRTRNWTRVAFFYNGQAFAKNEYDVKLERYHQLYLLKGTPSVEVRAVQVRLTYLGFDPRGVDGILGNGTRTALLAFQKAGGIPLSGEPDDATQEALKLAAGV
jgi:hypothetical protein